MHITASRSNARKALPFVLAAAAIAGGCGAGSPAAPGTTAAAGRPQAAVQPGVTSASPSQAAAVAPQPLMKRPGRHRDDAGPEDGSNQSVEDEDRRSGEPDDGDGADGLRLHVGYRVSPSGTAARGRAVHAAMISR